MNRNACDSLCYPKMKTILTFLLLISCFSSLFGCAGNMKNEKKIIIIFRFDDYSSTSNTQIEKAIIELFTSIERPFTIGVIPFTETENEEVYSALSMEKMKILKEADDLGIVDVALHGFSHTQVDAYTQSEFSTLSYSDQYQKISDAKSFLEDSLDQEIETFIPPWNSYDLNTINVLEALGFTTLSASKSGPATGTSTLSFLPYTAGVLELKNGIIAARKSFNHQPVAVILFHPYDFIEVDSQRGVVSLAEFSEILLWVKAQEDVQILSMNQAVRTLRDLSPHRFLAQQHTSTQFSFVESTLNTTKVNDFLYRVVGIPVNAWLRVVIFYSIFLISGAALVFFVCCFFFKLGKNKTLILFVLGFLSFLSLAYLGLHDGAIYKSGAIMLSILFGITVGLLLSFLYSDRIQKNP